MNQLILTGAELKKMFEYGYKNLYRAEKQVNELNVFPIPDGDTGTNMVKTLGGGIYSTEYDGENVSLFMEKFSLSTLLCARGNSGVILSQFIRGIAAGCEDLKNLNIKNFAQALTKGVEQAYTAVIKPVEGTMLTVMREGVETFVRYDGENDFSNALQYLIDKMKVSLSKTPEKLSVLKEAGVVDSGGLGIIYIFEGMKAYIDGLEIDIDVTSEASFENTNAPGMNWDVDSDSVFEYGYCTEFILQLLNKKTNIEEFTKENIVSYLENIGDSIVVVLDQKVLKVHVHTFEPEKVLAYARQYGEFISVKIENMSIQHSEFVQKKKHYKYAVVAVANGEGIKECFEQIGVAKIIEGGQTQNPSTKEFVDIFNELDAENIVVLPNNSNIILTARQAQEMCKKNVYVIPTKTIMEGYSALSMMDMSASDIDEFLESLKAPLSGVNSVSITTAVHDAYMNGVKVKSGDYMSVVDGNIMASSENRNNVVMSTLEKVQDMDEKQVVTIFRGKNVTEEDCNELADKIREKYPFAEVGELYGGQDIYDFYIALE